MNPNHWPLNDPVVLSYLYEGLIVDEGDFLPTGPWLAESWEFVDSSTFILKLKKSVNFHDGTMLNAAGFKYQFDYIMDVKNKCWTRGYLKPIKSIEVLDEYTLKFHFSKPWVSFPDVLASIPGYIIAPTALKGDVDIREAEELEREAKEDVKAAEKGDEKAKEKAAQLEEKAKQAMAKIKGLKNSDTNPVGTGPFVLEEASPGNYLKVKRNPNWWFGRSIGKSNMPYFDGMLFSVIPDPSVQMANLKAGKIDYLLFDNALYQDLKANPNFRVVTLPMPFVTGFSFNLAKGPCQDIRVRKALSHAIDRKALVVGTQYGLAPIASCLFPNNHWAHNPDLQPVSYDPELARKLLAEAGYAKGLTVKGFAGNTPEFTNVSEAVKAMLAKVGIDWQVVLLESAAMDGMRQKLDYDAYLWQEMYLNWPDPILTKLYHPQGMTYGRTKNQKVIELIEAARQELDLKKRRQIYHEVEKQIYDNYEDAWFYWGSAGMAYNKNVMGYNYRMHMKYGAAFWVTHPLWFKDGRP
jgi:peptide/nickel transport system substrate-binding protein